MKLIAIALIAVLGVVQTASAGFIPLVPQGARLLGGTGWDTGSDVAATADGSVYVLGHTRSRTLAGLAVQGEGDLVVAKYGPTGDPKWVRLIGGSGAEDPGGIAIDGDAIYIIGSSSSPSVNGATNHGGTDTLLARMSTDGEVEWLHLFGGARDDQGEGIAALDGQVYITGWFSTENLSVEAYVAKYDGAGDRQWSRRRSGDREDMGLAVAATPGGVFVSGQTWSTAFLGHKNKGESDAFLIRFDQQGRQQWARFFGTPAIDAFAAVTADQYSVYAAGWADTPLCCGQPSDFGNMLTTRWSVDGVRAWVERRGTANRLDMVHGIALSPGGGVLVAATTNVKPFDTADSKLSVIEYALAGGVSASRDLGGPKQDGAGGIVVGPNNTVWVVGYTRGPIGDATTAGKSDIVLYRLKYGKQG